MRRTYPHPKPIDVGRAPSVPPTWRPAPLLQRHAGSPRRRRGSSSIDHTYAQEPGQGPIRKRVPPTCGSTSIAPDGPTRRHPRLLRILYDTARTLGTAAVLLAMLALLTVVGLGLLAW
jgi:hypothetical protein